MSDTDTNVNATGNTKLTHAERGIRRDERESARNYVKELAGSAKPRGELAAINKVMTLLDEIIDACEDDGVPTDVLDSAYAWMAERATTLIEARKKQTKG